MEEIPVLKAIQQALHHMKQFAYVRNVALGNFETATDALKTMHIKGFVEKVLNFKGKIMENGVFLVVHSFDSNELLESVVYTVLIAFSSLRVSFSKLNPS